MLAKRFEILMIVVKMSYFNSKNDVRNRYHQSNCNITFIVSKMATFEVIINFHLQVTKIWQTKFKISLIVIKMRNFKDKNDLVN